jgi:putative aldouronate transport system permease protein
MKSDLKRIRMSAQLLLMLVPGVAYFLIFHYLPMYGLTIAFKDFRMDLGILGSPWVGLETFERLFSSRDFLQALRNTVVISLLHLGFGFFAPIILALLLHEVRMRTFVRTVQTMTYLPHFFSWVILGGIVIMFLSYEGPVNMLLRMSGLEPVQFLTNDLWFLATLVMTGIWQSAGFGSVIYLAALSGISPSLYEAALVDGASRWQQMWHITLPALRPTIIVLFILSLGNFLNAGFDQIYNLYNPLVYNVGDIIDTYVLRRLQTMDYSLATAAGFFKAVVGFLLIVMANTVARRLSDGEHGIW